MAAIDNIRAMAQKVYYSINKAQNDDTGEDLIEFEDNFIIAFNLWKEEYETETYWNQVYITDYELGTVSNTTTYSFELPEDYRTPVLDINKELKFVSDGSVIARFTMVNPKQRKVDDDDINSDRATFVGRNIVLSRTPTAEEVGATMVLDVVEYIPELTRTDDSALELLSSTQVAVLGIAKNETLADPTKVSLSPTFSQKYLNELNKNIAINDQTNAVNDMRMDDFSHIGGV